MRRSFKKFQALPKKNRRNKTVFHYFSIESPLRSVHKVQQRSNIAISLQKVILRLS